MRALTKARLRLRSLFRRRHADRELEAELLFHFDQLFAENVAAGLTPQEARRRALLQLGNIIRVQEECRDMRRVNLVDDLMRDFRFAGRSLRRNPGFAILAVLIMTLGIGANTAVFSIVNTVLLKPLAFREPDRIVTLSGSSTARGTTPGANDSLSRQSSMLDMIDWRQQSSSFQAMAYYNSREASVMSGAAADYAIVTKVSADFFRIFAVEPALGRVFAAEEVAQGSSGAVVISHAYWQNHFGENPNVLGQPVRVAGRSLPIVGVMPRGFLFPGKSDLWFPDTGTPDEPRAAHNYLVVGRLKPGVAVETVQSEMTVIARRLEEKYPNSNHGRGITVTLMREDMVGDIRLTLYLLLGAVSVVLLIACANTATLLLGKATSRTREVAVRVSLGASRQRIVRQLITESLLLAWLAGACGLLLAYGLSKVLVALAPANLPSLGNTGVDAGVLAFTFLISLATSLLFGLVPALYASRVDLNDALKQGGTRSVIGGRLTRLREGLVVVEIALAVVLLSGAGLLTKSFVGLQSVTLGFQTEHVLVMKATAARINPPAEQARRANQFFQELLSRVGGVPGVLAAGATVTPPGRVGSTGSYFVDHLPPPTEHRDMSTPGTVLSVVSPGTFAALGIPLKRGRDFSDADTSDKPFVAVVNEALVREAYPDQNPLGRTIFCPNDTSKPMTIIGIVGDVRQIGPARPPMPECYMTYLQHLYFGPTLNVVLRTTGNPVALTETVRRMVSERSPDVPVKFTTMETILSDNVAAPRFRTLLFGLFAALAVCLAMAGVYGVMAYAVSQRSSEIGLRMAVGASQGSVLRLVLRQGLTLAIAGLGIGLAASLAGTRLLTTLLFQVKPNDPVVYLAVAALLATVALAAAYLPARQASAIDPMTVLRDE